MQTGHKILSVWEYVHVNALFEKAVWVGSKCNTKMYFFRTHCIKHLSWVHEILWFLGIWTLIVCRITWVGEDKWRLRSVALSVQASSQTKAFWTRGLFTMDVTQVMHLHKYIILISWSYSFGTSTLCIECM